MQAGSAAKSRVKASGPAAAAGQAKTPGKAKHRTPEKRPLPHEDDEYEYTMRMDHGWTLSDGTFEGYPLNKRRKRDVPNPSMAFIQDAHRNMNSLTSLQLACNAPITMPTMDTCAKHIWQAWPPEIRVQAWIPPPNGPGLWGECEKTIESMYKQMDEKKNRFVVDPRTGDSRYSFFVSLQRRPWIIWPIYVEDEHGYDWITVFWHSGNSDTSKKAIFDKLIAYAIIDPRREPKAGPDEKHHPVKSRIDRIRERLFDIWERSGMDTAKAQELNILSSPIPLGEHCSGERCYSAMKDLGNQLIKWHINGSKFCPKTTFTNLSPWVNPYHERIEMGGITAWSLMAAFDFNARLTVEAIPPNQRVEVMVNCIPKYLYAYDLAGPPYDLFIASPDYLLKVDPRLSKR